MRRAAAASLWVSPCLLCLALYWPGVTAWFQADDFGWLNLAFNVRQGKPILEALFEPQAQGTFRVLSERAFFISFYNLFGLDALPYRIWVFLTQFANLLLLISVTQRLTRSRAAGWWAAVFWGVNVGLSVALVWTAVYNQVLCTFFVLLAFRLLLLYIDTGRRRYYWAQVLAFVIGFGALELMVVYPALAAAYTWVFARRHFRSVLPLVAISAGYAVLNRYAAPPATGLYAMQFDTGLLAGLWQYWGWSTGVGALRTVLEFPAAPVTICLIVLTGGVLAFVVARCRRHDWLPAFFLLWWLFLVSPYLPLSGHVSDYYTVLPALGVAMLGGYSLVAAPRVAAIPLAVLYLASAASASLVSSRYYAERSQRAKNLLAGVARAAQLHPSKTILLTDVDSDLFYTAVLDNTFRLVGAPKVFLAPGSDKHIPALPGIGDPAPFTVPAAAARRAVQTWSAVVYSAAGVHLKNITSIYRPPAPDGPPRLVNLANPLLGYLLGSGWYEVSGNHRWMSKRGTLRIGGPQAPGAQLHLSASSIQPLEVTVTADRLRLGKRTAPKGDVFLEFALPDELAGRESIEIGVEVSRTVRPPGDGRELGLAFGTFEVR
jgi:hypothetical protein